VTKIKIIDPTFNFKTYIENKEIKFHKFVTIHIYSNSVVEAPKAKSVGDIIRLRRFHFVLSERGELIAYETKFSNWLIYKGNKGDSNLATNYKAIFEDKNNNRALNPFEANRLSQLRDWSHKFFGEQKIKFVTWWSPLIEPANEKDAVRDRISSTDVDIILKATEVNAKENQIFFVDHGNKKYVLTLKANPVLKEGKVIKLRCINVLYTKDIRVIQITQKSSCLIVPEHFRDAIEFTKKGSASPRGSVSKTPERYSKTPNKSRANTPEKKTTAPPSSKQSKSPTPSRTSAKADFTADYDLPTGKKGSESITAIKRNYNKHKVTPMSELLDILQDPQAYVNKRFVVKGYILGFSEDKLNKIVKKMANGKVVNFDAKDKGVSSYLYHFNMNLKDSSIEGVDDTLSAYVLTNEADQHLFDHWGLLPSPEEVEDWEGLAKTKVSSFEKKFAALKSGHHEGKFVLELLITPKGKPFFKVYDTIFV
jgi:hypothetical protein